MWDLPIHPSSEPSVLADTPPRVYPLRGSASSLAHRLVSSSDTICNSPSSPLADIVFFGLPLKVFKTLERGFHTLIKNVRSPPQPTWDLTKNMSPFNNILIAIDIKLHQKEITSKDQ